MPGKVPTRSPTHEEVEPARLAGMGIDLEDNAQDGAITLAKIVEIAEDYGRPPSHYIAAIPLATELTIAPVAGATVTAKLCTGTCQRYGALDLIEHLLAKQPGTTIAAVECLDQCDHGPAVELSGPGGKLVLAPASATELDQAIAALQ